MKKNILKGTSLVLLASMALVACKKETDFTVENPTAWVGEPVKVKDNNEKYKKNTVVVYDFGDGQQSEEVGDWSRVSQINPTHRYRKAGVYTITQQVMKTGNIQKRSGKTYVGSQTVTIQTVAPTMELSVASPSTNQLVLIKNTTDETGNKGSEINYNVVIQTPTGIQDLGWNYGNTRSFEWTPQASGAYKITLYAYQWDSKTMVSADVTVTGQNDNALLSSFMGKWNVSATASLTGNSYGNGTTCDIARTLTSRYSSISFRNNGNAYAYTGVVANVDIEPSFPSTTTTAIATAEAGNVEEPGLSLSVTDAGLVNVPSGFLAKTSTTYAVQQNSSEAGLYTVKSATATSIVLERVVKGSSFCSSSSDTFTDTYTITLTK